MDPKALSKLSYGIYVVSSKKGDKLNGQIANSVFQVSAQPRLIAAAINKKNLTHEFIAESKVFSVSVLSNTAPLKFIGDFGFRSGRNTDKFTEHRYKTGSTGCPIPLEYSVAFIETEMISSCEAGTHTLFIGKVVNAEILNSDETMTYDYYKNVVKGKSPESAPTYVKEGEK